MDKQAKLRKDFLRYVSLNMLGMIGQSFYVLADTYFIAQAEGSRGIAALNLSIPMFGFIFGFGLMIGLGGATQFAISKAKKELADAHHFYTQSILFGSLCGGFLVLLGLFFAPQLAQLLGANDSALPLTVTYLRTILLFGPFFILNNIQQAFVRNDGNPSLAMKAMLIGSLANVVLDYILIFPMNLGMFGAALATGISPIIGLVICLFHYQDIFHQLQFKKEWIQLRALKRISFLGATGLVNELASAVVMFTFNTIIFSLEGNNGLAAYGIIANTSFVVLSILTGLAQGVQPLLSENYGKKDLNSLFKVLHYSIVSSLCLSAVIYLGTYVFAPQLANIFNSESIQVITDMATTGLRIYFVGFFFAGINIVLNGYFAAIAESRSALYFSLIRGGFVLIPLVIGLSILFELTGVWISFVVAEGIVLLMMIGYIRYVKKDLLHVRSVLK